MTVFFPLLFRMKLFTFRCYRFLNGGGTKEHSCVLSFFTAITYTRGVCIEGTSMHLNCLHGKWKKQFYHLGRRRKNKWEKESGEYRPTSSRTPTHTHIHTILRVIGHKNTRSNMRRAHTHHHRPLDDKTAYSTTHCRSWTRSNIARCEAAAGC